MAVAVPKKKTYFRYGREWDADTHPVNCELVAFRDNISEEKGGLGRIAHFKNIVNYYWNPPNPYGVKFIWHPWADEMLEALCYNNYVGLAGCGSSGKSEMLAIWAIVNWMAAPLDTLVLVTSTTIRDAKKRIWGSIQRYFQALPPNSCPGKLRDAPEPGVRVEFMGKKYDQAGIYLIPSEPKKAREISSKMQGMKNYYVFLVADELSELSDILITTSKANLESNPRFHMSAASNPKSYFDPFGLFVEPVDGWDSITVEDEEWDTKFGGKCLHFDALKNPNYLAKKNLWPIMRYEKVEKAIEEMNQDSIDFWRMFRGFWCPMGDTQRIYTEADIIKYGGNKKAIWIGDRTRVAGLDPAFTSGGDRCVLYFGWYGVADTGKKTVELDKYYIITEDVTNKTDSRNFQVARKIIELLQKEGCDYKNFATDYSGGGTPFADILAETFGRADFYRVQFGGGATDKPVSEIDATPSNKRYANRVSELAFSGVHYLRGGQLKGITPDLASEMCQREYTTRKAGGEMQILVEAKSEMKIRIGKSPDIFDAMLVLLALCREKLGASPARKLKKSSTWKSLSRRYDVVSKSQMVNLKG